ncbi:hypothetical protein Bca52824_031706 [Brassica carinata]|uniref:Uncharacterized protein n=1 Tax=Brassica carinata TaxID=52824 RepID=A0A8X7SCM2_BRACI|nr:hypothetical protein Bca52824_031706 [Brassica carinata]
MFSYLKGLKLSEKITKTDSVYDSEKLGERITKLWFVDVIKVGAENETELVDFKLRKEYAKNTTFAAIKEGIVPAGGATLVFLLTVYSSHLEETGGL